MKTLLKINTNGNLVEFNSRLNRWELTNRLWAWSDISHGYKLESKRNYKRNK